MKILNFELVSVGDAARHYGVSVSTMRRSDRQGKVKVGYARVCYRDQKKDLVTQSDYLSPFCDVVLEDLGSGVNWWLKITIINPCKKLSMVEKTNIWTVSVHIRRKLYI